MMHVCLISSFLLLFQAWCKNSQVLTGHMSSCSIRVSSLAIYMALRSALSSLRLPLLALLFATVKYYLHPFADIPILIRGIIYSNFTTIFSLFIELKVNKERANHIIMIPMSGRFVFRLRVSLRAVLVGAEGLGDGGACCCSTK